MVVLGAVVLGMTLLDYHWISDFIAGACIGALLLAAVTTAPGWLRVAAPIARLLWRDPTDPAGAGDPARVTRG